LIIETGQRKQQIINARIDFEGARKKLLNGINENLVDLAEKAINEIIQKDNSIKESINKDLLEHFKYQVNGQLGGRMRDELSRINANLKLTNENALKSVKNVIGSTRELILNRINNTLEDVLNQMRGWKRLDQRKAKKLMEDRLTLLKVKSSIELKLIKVEIFKFTKLKMKNVKNILE
jgi:hypothetical protein